MKESKHNWRASLLKCYGYLFFMVVCEIWDEDDKSQGAPHKRMNALQKFIYLLKGRMGGAPSHLGIPSGLCQQQRRAYELASNLSDVHGPMVMASMWNGWKLMRRSLVDNPPTAFEQYVNGGLLIWLELMESLEAKDMVAAVESNGASLFGVRVCPESLSSINGTKLEVRNVWHHITSYTNVVVSTQTFEN